MGGEGGSEMTSKERGKTNKFSDVILESFHFASKLK